MYQKNWGEFFLYLGRVLILLLLLAVLLPRLVNLCGTWMSTVIHDDRKPSGNPLRVEAPIPSKSVIFTFSNDAR